MTEPKELTGIEGRDAAFADPENWQAHAYDTRTWNRYDEWRAWSFAKLSDPSRKWRKTPKPEPVRPTRLEAETYLLRNGETISIGIPHKDAVIVQLVLDGYDGKQARIVVDELVKGQTAQPEPAAKMTGAEATKYLQGAPSRAVMTKTGGTWASADHHGLLPEEFAPYTPLFSATHTQVALEKELAEARAHSVKLKTLINELGSSREEERIRSAQLAEDCHALSNSNHSLSLRLDDAISKSAQIAEDNATLRDAMGHAGNELYMPTGDRVSNAINWLNSGLNRTKTP